MVANVFDVVFHTANTSVKTEDTSVAATSNMSNYSNTAFVESIYWKIKHTKGDFNQRIGLYKTTYITETATSLGGLYFTVIGPQNIQARFRALVVAAKTVYINDNMLDVLFVMIWSSSSINLTIMNEMVYKNIAIGLFLSTLNQIVMAPMMIVAPIGFVVKKIRTAKSNKVTPLSAPG